MRNWLHTATLVIIAGLAPAMASAADLTMYERASRDHRQLFDQIVPGLIAEADEPPLILADEGESYFWEVAHRVDPLIEAYQYTRDPMWLDKYVPIQQSVLSQRWVDPNPPHKYTGWYYGDAASYSYMVIHAAIAYYNPALLFIREVRADPALQGQYGTIAEQWFDDMTTQSIPAWDLLDSWRDLGPGEGWYFKLTHQPDTQTGQIVPLTNNLAGTSYAVNKLHAMIESFCLLYEMTGDPWYRQRIEQCETFFRNMWRDEGDHVWWYYRPRTRPWDYNSNGSQKFSLFVHRKSGYYAADIRAIVACYQQGLVFTDDDIDKLIQTNLEFMWLGDTVDPAFGKINGTYDAEHIGQLWTALAPYSELTRQLWRTQLDLNTSSWSWEASAIAYLRASFESATTADAGEDQTVPDTGNDGVELVWLDGTHSNCTDGAITGYVWTEDGVPLGYDSVIPVALTPGEHTITLTVTTDYGAKNVDTVAVTVGLQPGDCDGDGDVDMDDFVILKQNFLTPSGATQATGDFDGDGDVDLDDFVILKQNFGT